MDTGMMKEDSESIQGNLIVDTNGMNVSKADNCNITNDRLLAEYRKLQEPEIVVSSIQSIYFENLIDDLINNEDKMQQTISELIDYIKEETWNMIIVSEGLKRKFFFIYKNAINS